MPQYVETNFDERSGIISCPTEWGRWWQTVSEVHVEVDVPQGSSARDIKIVIKPSSIRVNYKEKMVLEGPLYAIVIADESLWTLEDKKLIHITLVKADASAKETVWEGLLKDAFLADPWSLLEMRKKLDLEHFQMENPGFDFSGATLSKCYDKVPESEMTKWKESQRSEVQSEGNE